MWFLRNRAVLDPSVREQFDLYLHTIVRKWMQVLTLMAAGLIPLFLLLDYYTQPPDLLSRFASYRLVATLIMLTEYFVIRWTRPSRFYPLHGYLVSLVIGMMIILMTVDLGGFDSAYYAGLMLVIMAVNMLLSWRPIHSAINATLVIGLYLASNILISQPYDAQILASNLYFLIATAIITFAISWVRFGLVRSEFILRSQLVGANRDLDKSRAEVLRARDALWGDMQLARMIQMALLPSVDTVGPYQVAAFMLPADSVGGDYFDIIETSNGAKWAGIGDVSGHGVESGLIMMMAQTAIRSILQQPGALLPSQVLDHANRVIKQNIAQLDTDRYMTMLLFRLEWDHMLVAGKHTDIMIYRTTQKKIEMLETKGSWLGIVDDLGAGLEDLRIPMEIGDIVLLYSDGITEACDRNNSLFGEESLAAALLLRIHLPLAQIGQEILGLVSSFQETQHDDMTLLLLKR